MWKFQVDSTSSTEDIIWCLAPAKKKKKKKKKKIGLPIQPENHLGSCQLDSMARKYPTTNF